MGSGELTSGQKLVLQTLSGFEPSWTLTGGAALVGFLLGHRTTRDLDLFVHGQATLDDYAARVTEKLQDAGMEVHSLQSGSAMCRLQVSINDERVLVDLVAEPVATVEPPVEHAIGEAVILVDTPHEILVNKLCTLVQRSELRDLIDVHGLLGAGGELERALRDAPKKDSGFSPMTLTWLLKELDITSIGEVEGWPASKLTELERFRETLISEIAALAHP